MDNKDHLYGAMHKERHASRCSMLYYGWSYGLLYCLLQSFGHVNFFGIQTSDAHAGYADNQGNCVEKALLA